MSKWTDMQKRSSGDLKREEDKSIRSQWIKEFMELHPNYENEFRQLYIENPSPILDHFGLIKPDAKPSKSFETQDIVWYSKDISKKFWKI